MYARQITSEETYTLSETKRIINAERQAKRESSIYKVKQKLLGTFCIISSVLALILTKSDVSITYSFIMIPIGLLLICTREKVIY